MSVWGVPIIMCVSTIEVYFWFILIAAFIVDVGRVTFGRGVSKIRVFSFTMIWLNYLIKYCMIKMLVFVSFPNSTIRLKNLVYLSQTAWTVYRQSLERLYFTLHLHMYTSACMMRSCVIYSSRYDNFVSTHTQNAKHRVTIPCKWVFRFHMKSGRFQVKSTQNLVKAGVSTKTIQFDECRRGAMTLDFMKSRVIAPSMHPSNWRVFVETSDFIRSWVDFTCNPPDFKIMSFCVMIKYRSFVFRKTN